MSGLLLTWGKSIVAAVEVPVVTVFAFEMYLSIINKYLDYDILVSTMLRLFKLFQAAPRQVIKNFKSIATRVTSILDDFDLVRLMPE